MKDKTTKTQSELFYETTADVLGCPRGQVIFVLPDHTASVSGNGGGCVKLLQRMLRGEGITAGGRM